MIEIDQLDCLIAETCTNRRRQVLSIPCHAGPLQQTCWGSGDARECSDVLKRQEDSTPWPSGRSGGTSILAALTCSSASTVFLCISCG